MSKLKKYYILGSNITIVLMLTFLASFIGFYSVTNVSIEPMKDLYRNGNINKKDITLMFNVYWGNEYINGILNELKDRNLKTTFFVGGIWAEKYPDLLKKIFDEGHEIGNHGYKHREHSKLNSEENKEEILNTDKIVKDLLGVDMKFFAPPSGDYNELTISVASQLNYKTILWTKDTIDWRDNDSAVIYNRAIKNLNNGDFILMHPTKHTLKALPKILSYCEENGFNITTLSKNIGL